MLTFCAEQNYHKLFSIAVEENAVTLLANPPKTKVSVRNVLAVLKLLYPIIVVHSHIQITVIPDSLTKELSAENATIGKELFDGHLPSLAKAIVQHPALIGLVFELFTDQISSECNSLCRRGPDIVPSLFRNYPAPQLVDFKWQQCIDELQCTAPRLLQVLTAITSKNDKRNTVKQGSAHFPGVCTAVAVTLKERNREISGIQSLVSILLMMSGVDKKVCNFLCIVNNSDLFVIVCCRYIHD